VKEGMRTAVMIDGRRVFDREEISRYGFIFRGIGSKRD